MPSMTKRVNVYAQVAVRNITPPIYGTCKDIVMSTGDILKCLCKRARVEEILPDGSTVRLNLQNYYRDNGAGLDASKNKKVEELNSEKNKAEPSRFKVPVAPSVEAQVVETKTETSVNNDMIKEESSNETVSCEPENTKTEAEMVDLGTMCDAAEVVANVKDAITTVSTNETITVSIKDNDTISGTNTNSSNTTVTTSNSNNNHNNSSKKKKK